MKSARVFSGVLGVLIVALSVAGQQAQSADPAPAKLAIKRPVVAYEEGQSITIEAATAAGMRKFEFAIVKEKTGIKLLGDALALKVGMGASVWTEKGTTANKPLARKIEAQ